MNIKYRFWTEEIDLYGLINRAYEDWKNNWPANGKKYVWFEHHSEIVLGFKCRVDYSGNRITNVEVVDPNKYLLFEIKYSR